MLDTMTQDKWNRMTPAEKDKARDLSDLSPNLVGWEGWRVEATDQAGEKHRFIVGRSTGWRPCHLEISRRNARSGPPASKGYVSVKGLYRVR